jgi:CNT family concentrative nucleoside transporter
MNLTSVNKNLLRAFGITALLCIFFTNQAVAKNNTENFPKQLLLKKWQQSSGELTFLNDGTCTISATILPDFKNTNWKLENNKLAIFNNVDTAIFTIIRLNNRELTLSAENSKPISFIEEKQRNDLGFNFLGLSRGLLGLMAVLGIAFLFSSDRRAINWALVGKGISIQLILAFLILKVPFVESAFDILSKIFTKVVNMSHDGATFIFAAIGDVELNPTAMNFVTWILPSVIFFSALSSLLYYWGILQKFVYGMAWFMHRAMGLSGAESVAAAGNVFLGQTEAPLLVKPYLERMTKSELLSLMVGGMATIAGGVLAAYIGFLGKGDPIRELYFAKHLLTASIMSAPAAIVFAKILYPEKENVLRDLSVSKERLGGSTLEAIANGTTDGVRLAVNVAAMLLVFISLIALCNFGLDLLGRYTGLNDLIASVGLYDKLSFEFIMGYIFAPLAWIMGVPWEDAVLFGQLLGEKTILNEFVAYPHLGELQDRMSKKSVLMATYALCGFANFASIGIQIGGIGALAPSRKGELAKFGIKALIGGTLACLSTAVLVGMIF